MMGETEIVKALRVLKATCSGVFYNKGCRCCPLRNSLTEKCGLQNIEPCFYHIAEFETARPLLIQEETKC